MFQYQQHESIIKNIPVEDKNGKKQNKNVVNVSKNIKDKHNYKSKKHTETHLNRCLK